MTTGLIALPKDTPWPLSIEGVLEISVEKGEVGEDEISEVNFGTLTTEEGTVLIEISDRVIRDADLSRDDLYASKRFIVVLEGIGEHTGVTDYPPGYRVGRIESV